MSAQCIHYKLAGPRFHLSHSRASNDHHTFKNSILRTKEVSTTAEPDLAQTGRLNDLPDWLVINFYVYKYGHTRK